MENFSQSVRNVFKNAGRAFGNYPIVLASAFIFVLAALFDISLDYGSDRENYQLLLTSIRLAAALAAMLGLAAITWARTRQGTPAAFRNANLLAAGAGIVTFVMLYFFSGVRPDYYQSPAPDFLVVHPMAAYRVAAVILISILAFILFAAHPDEEEDFSGSLVMTIKAFFQGLLFGIVTALGALAVAGAISALIYELPGKVYGYIAVLSGFLAFTIFIGFFPDFRKGPEDPQVKNARAKPRFLSVLLDYILVPIMLAFTLVLLLWAVRTIFEGMDTDFPRLFAISSGYAAAGLILHILVTHSTTGMAKFYRKVFPLAVLPILAFEAWALILEISRYGVRTVEYLFILGWIITFSATLLLILRRQKAHPAIVLVVSAAAVIAVLPFVGFGDLPVLNQLNRLERLLENENMLQDGKIVPARQTPALSVREDISSAVEYLIYVPHAEYPDWLDAEALRNRRFESIMGFPNTVTGDGDPGAFQELVLFMPGQVVDVSGYQWSILTGGRGEGLLAGTAFTGTRGDYDIQWESSGKQGISAMKLSLNGEVILEEEFQGFIDAVKAKYPSLTGQVEAQPEDLFWRLDSEELELVFIVRSLQISGGAGEEYYFMDLATILMNEKP